MNKHFVALAILGVVFLASVALGGDSGSPACPPGCCATSCALSD
jgi:hypothetical protein